MRLCKRIAAAARAEGAPNGHRIKARSRRAERPHAWRGAGRGRLAPHAVSAQTILQKAERDEIAIVANDDPAMAAAFRQARATLGDFLTIAAAPKPSMENFAVKVAVHDGDNNEYFWIDPFTDDHGRFSGRINNKPEMVHTVRMGQLISFSRDEIVDWMYMDGGKMKGNYTACALLKSAPKNEAEEFKERFGLNCEF